jgi:ribosome-associated heat shock protein Hsp15
MRLDKFLFFTRLTKTRTLAQSIISQGHVRIDGLAITNHHPNVAVGKVITVPLHDKIRVIRVEALPKRRGPAAEAQSCYCDMTTQSAIDVALD